MFVDLSLYGLEEIGLGAYFTKLCQTRLAAAGRVATVSARICARQ
jgi:hypothetical protein